MEKPTCPKTESCVDDGARIYPRYYLGEGPKIFWLIISVDHGRDSRDLGDTLDPAYRKMAVKGVFLVCVIYPSLNSLSKNIS